VPFRSDRTAFFALELHIFDRFTFIENERTSQRTELNQPVPIGGVAGQSRYFQPHHQPCFAQGHVTDELLKSITARGP